MAARTSRAAAGVLAGSQDVIILAIDPGISGAFALLGDTVLVDDLPVHVAQHGQKAKVRAELDVHGFHRLLKTQPIAHAFIEQVNAMPMQGVTGVFRFGYAAGSLYGVLVAHDVPVTFVRPQDWQKHHRIGPTPDAARQRAVQLYPALASRLARKCDHHRADALLLAQYGRCLISREDDREPPIKDWTGCAAVQRKRAP
jgi:crossover junction endodeoxyribonuclease RuvC